MQKGVFCLFFLFGGLVFSLFFLVWKKAQKGYFPAILEFFLLLCPQKACLQNPSFLPILFSFLVFLLSSLSKLHFFLCFLSINPFWKTLIVLLSLSFFFLPFPVLMFACFFQTNFPNIPFLKPKLLSFWLFVYFFCCFCFSFSCFMSLPFCFDAGFVFLYVLLCSCLVLFVSCFAFTDYEKYCFPCNSSVLSC